MMISRHKQLKSDTKLHNSIIITKVVRFSSAKRIRNSTKKEMPNRKIAHRHERFAKTALDE